MRTLITYRANETKVYMHSHDTEWTRVIHCDMRGCGRRFQGPRNIWDDLQAAYRRAREHALTHG